MSKTRDDLIKQALVNLGLIAEGQVFDAGMVSKMDALVDPAMNEINALGIYYVQDTGSLGPDGGVIDDGPFLSLADYLANRACAAFNLPADTKMQALAQIAEDKLRTMSAPPRNKRFLSLDAGVRPYRRGYLPIR